MDASSALDFIRTLWPIFVAGIGLVVWLVRLEGKVKHLDEKIKTTDDGLKEIRIELKDIREHSNTSFSDIKGDIRELKTLIQMMVKGYNNKKDEDK